MALFESLIFGVLFYLVYRAETAALNPNYFRVSSVTGAVKVRKPTSGNEEDVSMLPANFLANNYSTLC